VTQIIVFSVKRKQGTNVVIQLKEESVMLRARAAL